MKSAGSNQKSQSSQGQKPHSAGISNRPSGREEQEQRQVPKQGQAKKDSAHRQGGASSPKR